MSGGFHSIVRGAQSGTAGWLLHAALLLSLWNAPIPWVHFHGTLGEARCGASSLSRHLARFHAAVRPLDEAGFGWHVHYILPWCVSDDGPHPAQGGPDDFRDVAVGPGLGLPAFDVAPHGMTWLTALTADDHSPATADAAALRAAAEILRPPVPPTAHFLQAGSVALRDLLCVARC